MGYTTISSPVRQVGDNILKIVKYMYSTLACVMVYEQGKRNLFLLQQLAYDNVNTCIRYLVAKCRHSQAVICIPLISHGNRDLIVITLYACQFWGCIITRLLGYGIYCLKHWDVLIYYMSSRAMWKSSLTKAQFNLMQTNVTPVLSYWLTHTTSTIQTAMQHLNEIGQELKTAHTIALDTRQNDHIIITISFTRLLDSYIQHSWHYRVPWIAEYLPTYLPTLLHAILPQSIMLIHQLRLKSRSSWWPPLVILAAHHLFTILTLLYTSSIMQQTYSICQTHIQPHIPSYHYTYLIRYQHHPYGWFTTQHSP